MQKVTRTFYQYLGIHSLLIGIFPFFIPVFLWKQHFGIDAISMFIGSAGVGFCVGLWVWDRLRTIISLSKLIALSLLLELLLLLNVQVLGMSFQVLLVLGISYGVYNSFFWTTQRALFFEGINSNNSGRRYGNLQIYVGFLLQVGILIGGYFLEKSGFTYIFMGSAGICILGLLIFLFDKPINPEAVSSFKPISFSEILKFNDNDASKLIFITDGIYLFLESFFWVISLFLLAHESFTTLGAMVLGLAVIFGLLFYALKNTIDRLGRRRIYRFAVLLYALSWVLRAVMDNSYSLVPMFISLVLITFCTSFFRLALNKRFYDLAKETLSHRYLILKSYYSQITIAIVFIGFGWAVQDRVDTELLLGPIYWLAAAGALTFLRYGAQRYDKALAEMPVSPS